jgi:hypothetical protein
MRADLRLISSLVLGALIAGCGQIPQPFQPPEWEKEHNEFLLAPLATGVTVRRIEGPVGWVGDAMTQAMAEALREKGIAAGSKWSNRLALTLAGSGYQKLHEAKAPELVMSWTLFEPGGRVRDRRDVSITPPDAFWEAPTADMFREVAERNAEIVVAWIDPTREDRTPVTAELPSIVIMPIEGAPGDGATSLARAVILALRAERIAVTENGTGDLVVTSKVEVTPAPDKTEDVRVTWIVSRPEGALIGRVAQENQIPAGQLDDRWGAVAVAIADGAAAGIAGLARAYRDTGTTVKGGGPAGATQ